MSETAKSALRTIILELARGKRLKSIKIGVAFDLESGRFRAIKFKIDPKVKFIIEPAVLELIADVESQQVWKWIEEARNSGNQKLAYEIFKDRFPAYSSISDSILDELFATLSSRTEPALETRADLLNPSVVTDAEPPKPNTTVETAAEPPKPSGIVRRGPKSDDDDRIKEIYNSHASEFAPRMLTDEAAKSIAMDFYPLAFGEGEIDELKRRKIERFVRDMRNGKSWKSPETTKSPAKTRNKSRDEESPWSKTKT